MFGMPAGMPGCQGTVPHHSHAAECASQQLLLRLVRIRPASVRRPHPYGMPAMTVKPWEVRDTRFLPGLNAGASTLKVW